MKSRITLRVIIQKNTLRTAAGNRLFINSVTASKSGFSPPIRSVTVYPSPNLELQISAFKMGTPYSSFPRHFAHPDGTTSTMTTPTRNDCVTFNITRDNVARCVLIIIIIIIIIIIFIVETFSRMWFSKRTSEIKIKN